MFKKILLPVITVIVLGAVIAPSPSPTLPPKQVLPATPKLSFQTSTSPTRAVTGAHSTPHVSVTDKSATSPSIDLVAAAPLTPLSVSGSVAPVSLVKEVGSQVLGQDGKLYPLRTYKAVTFPNDPSASQPWVTSANLGAAWNIPRGNHPTLLAIIDTGFALKHEEFQGRFYTNPGEVGPTTVEAPSLRNCTDRGLPLDLSCNLIDTDGDAFDGTDSGPTTVEAPSRLNCSDRGLPLDKSCNRMDNDGNGLINDVTGYDFADDKSSVQAGEINPSGNGTHHGTYTTGVAAATGNNGVGIAGVDWGTTILPIQALDDNGAGNTATVTNAINYAISQKANVISMSLGSTYDDPLVHQAVDKAIAAGIVVVAAAGNDGCSCMLYPANYPEVLSVGALDPSTGQPASFSSYGPNLKILAPGVNLYTTDWQPGNQTSAYASGISGTSLATPIVSGLITRLLSQQPTASPRQLMAALLENTNRLSLPANVNRSDALGFGLIDAGRASQRMASSYSPIQLYGFSQLSFGNFLSPASPTDQANGYTYQCPTGAFGSTPIYLLSQTSSSFFTSSTVENQNAIAQGYSSRFFTYGCTAEPQDNPTMVRSINMLSEFLNLPANK